MRSLGMREYLVVFEKSATGYAAYVPDLPGCTSTGATLEEVSQGIKEAIAGHVAVLKEYGEPIPESTTRVNYVALAS
jgi:predicted RNase H-like HicB family nuclease